MAIATINIINYFLDSLKIFFSGIYRAVAGCLNMCMRTWIGVGVHRGGHRLTILLCVCGHNKSVSSLCCVSSQCGN